LQHGAHRRAQKANETAVTALSLMRDNAARQRIPELRVSQRGIFGAKSPGSWAPIRGRGAGLWRRCLQMQT
jgi:hypothetical protein